MIAFGRLLGLLALLGVGAIAGAADPPVAAEPTPQQLVLDLGSPNFQVREKASKALWKLGEKARPVLAEAVKSADAEVAQRAQEILEKFDAGILPETPPEIVGHIRDFRSNLFDKQRLAIVALLKLGEPGTQALRQLLAKELPESTRGPLFEFLTATLRHEVPKLLYADKPDRAEAMLALNTLGTSGAGMLDYAVWIQMRGQAKAKAEALEKVRMPDGQPSEATAKALVYLYRAAGDAKRAKAAAVVAEKLDPAFHNAYDSLLEDLGDWAELADRPFGRVNSTPGLRMFRLRLGGRLKEADEVAEGLKDDAGDGRGGTLDQATLAFMLNDRPLDGIDRLKVQRNAPHILADCMASRLQFSQALDLLGGNKKLDEVDGEDSAKLRTLYGTRRGRLLWQLGRRDAAAQVFAAVAEQITNRDDDALIQLVRAEVRAGRQDLACEHLGKFMVGADEGGLRVTVRQDPFEVLFDADADCAQYWWRVLRQAKPAGEEPGTTMRKVRALLTGTATTADLDAAMKASLKEVPVAESPDGQGRAMARAAVLRAHGKAADAIADMVKVADQLTKPVAPNLDPDDEEAEIARVFGRGSRSWVFGTDERFRFWLELGDLLLEQRNPRDAALRLEQGWKRFPDNPTLLFLSGKALQKAGDDKEGKRRIELAHQVALGNPRVRGRFLEELVTRGYTADAKRERDLVCESAWVSEIYLGNVWNQVARASALVRDYPAAAAANRRAIHYLLRTPNVTYVEGYAYLTVPQGVRANEARGLLAAGKVDEAMAIARECLAVMPGNTDLVIGMVPELDRLGKTKEADELFGLAWGSFGKLLKENPESGWAKFSAAWLAAGCRRELPAAQAFAETAVEAEPGMKNYKEALAEVYFRRGERAKAVAIMTELAAKDWRNHHYKRQLDRYKTADPTSAVPEGDDD